MKQICNQKRKEKNKYIFFKRKRREKKTEKHFNN